MVNIDQLSLSQLRDWLSASLTDTSGSSRSLSFFVVWLLIWLPIALPLAIQLRWRPFQPATVTQKLPLVLSLYALAPLVLWGAAQVEQVSLAAYGITWNGTVGRSLVLGLSIGVLGVCLLFGSLCGLGCAVWQGTVLKQLATTLLLTLSLGLWVSAIEEAIFRGFLLHQLQQDFPIVVAAIVSSLIFALLHWVWEGFQVVPQLPGLWLMGLVLVLARWVDGGSLGLACGLHAGWIWAMASIDSAQLIRLSDRPAEWLTGWRGQPLAGAIGLLLLACTGSGLWLWRHYWSHGLY